MLLYMSRSYLLRIQRNTTKRCHIIDGRTKLELVILCVLEHANLVTAHNKRSLMLVANGKLTVFSLFAESFGFFLVVFLDIFLIFLFLLFLFFFL